MTRDELYSLLVELHLDPNAVLDEAVRSELDLAEPVHLDSFAIGFMYAAILYSSDDEDGRAHDDPSWSGEPDPLFQPGVFR